MTLDVKIFEIEGIEYISIDPIPIDPVEFRLYYDDNGKPLFYSCEKHEGNYIVIDKQTYAEMRHDIRVINGEIRKLISGIIISKLKPNDIEGTICAIEDVSIVVNSEYSKSQKWKLDLYELL